jgi:hypothetical protein
MAAMTTATKVPSLALLAPPVNFAGRVASAPLSPVLTLDGLEPVAGAAADLKVDVPFTGLYGGLAIVGTAPDGRTSDPLGFGDRFVTGATEDLAGPGAEAALDAGEE